MKYWVRNTVLINQIEMNNFSQTFLILDKLEKLPKNSETEKNSKY